MRLAELQPEIAVVQVNGVLVRRSWQKHLLTFLKVFGPGLIVMEADAGLLPAGSCRSVAQAAVAARKSTIRSHCARPLPTTIARSPGRGGWKGHFK